MNKKRVSVLLSMFFCVGGFFASFPALKNTASNVTAQAAENEVSGIGFSVNIVKQAYGSVDIGNAILDGGYIKDSLEPSLVKTDSDRYFHTAQTYETYKEFAESVKMRSQILEDKDFGAEVYPFLTTINDGFTTVLEKGNLSGTYYYEWFLYRGIYTLSLPETDNFAQTYAAHYDGDFLNVLEKLKSKEWTYKQFFDRCGTHFVGGREYGGSILGFCREFSYGKFFDGDDKSDFLKEYRTYEQNIFEGKSSWGFDYTHVKQADSVLNTQGLKAWLDKLKEGNVAPVGYGGHLLPIYEILPVEYAEMKNEMQTAFESYAKENTALYENAVKQKPVEPPIDPDVQESPASEVDWKRVALYSVAGGIVVAGIMIGAAAIVRKKKKS